MLASGRITNIWSITVDLVILKWSSSCRLFQRWMYFQKVWFKLGWTMAIHPDLRTNSSMLLVRDWGQWLRSFLRIENRKKHPIGSMGLAYLPTVIMRKNQIDKSSSLMNLIEENVLCQVCIAFVKKGFAMNLSIGKHVGSRSFSLERLAFEHWHFHRPTSGREPSTCSIDEFCNLWK